MTEIPTLKHPKLARLLDYWLERRNGAPLPRRTDIDPLDMKEWLGNLLLMDCADGGDWRYRLYGSEFVQEFGREMTGHLISELPGEQQRLIQAEYERARASGWPSSRVYTAEFDIATLIRRPGDGTKWVTWERLILPLAGPDGAVQMLLVGAYALKFEEA